MGGRVCLCARTSLGSLDSEIYIIGMGWNPLEGSEKQPYGPSWHGFLEYL